MNFISIKQRQKMSNQLRVQPIPYVFLNRLIRLYFIMANRVANHLTKGTIFDYRFSSQLYFTTSGVMPLIRWYPLQILQIQDLSASSQSPFT